VHDFATNIIRWAGLTPKAGRYPTLCGRKISQYVGQSSF